MNCHGCKWLDEVTSQGNGNGYCSQVVRSKGYRSGDKVRHPNNPPCELYEPGDFTTRFGTPRK